MENFCDRINDSPRLRTRLTPLAGPVVTRPRSRSVVNSDAITDSLRFYEFELSTDRRSNSFSMRLYYVKQPSYESVHPVQKSLCSGNLNFWYTSMCYSMIRPTNSRVCVLIESETARDLNNATIHHQDKSSGQLILLIISTVEMWIYTQMFLHEGQRTKTNEVYSR